MAGLSGWNPSQLVLTVIPRECVVNGVMDFKITLGEMIVLSVSLDSTSHSLLNPQKSDFHPFHFTKTALAKFTSGFHVA